jgi:hypothetical protein
MAIWSIVNLKTCISPPRMRVITSIKKISSWLRVPLFNLLGYLEM